MAVQIIGSSGVIADVNPDKSTFVEIRPPAIGALGVYNTIVVTGNIAATLAAGSTLVSFRWSDATRLAVVRYVRASAIVTATMTTGVLFDLDLVVARSFTVSDSGGTVFVPLGVNNKMRTSMGSSLLTDLRVATTVPLTVGTRTLDANAMGRLQGFTGLPGPSSGAVGAPFFGQAFSTLIDRSLRVGAYPLVLAQNEGFIVRNPLIGPATGTFQIMLEIEWSEVPSY